eukprot:CFRG6481T1
MKLYSIAALFAIAACATAEEVSTTDLSSQIPVVVSISVSVTPSPSPCVSPSAESQEITCKIKDSESEINCAGDEVFIDDRACCRNSGLCGSLPKCQTKTCCEEHSEPIESPVVAPEPTMPTPSPIEPTTSPITRSDTITCAIKDSESSLKCGGDMSNDKECCRYTSNGDNCEIDLDKCTSSYCCTSASTPAPKPSPSSMPSEEGGYEPVDQYITCAVKEYEGGFECHGGEVVDSDKQCCRWSGDCGDLRKCTESYCCSDNIAVPSPVPSNTPKPIDYAMTCAAKSGLSCKSGYELDREKECCEYSGECGSWRKCTESYCCDTVDDTPPPTDTEGACGCSGAILNTECYSALALAVDAASNGDTIFIGNEIEISSPIQFTKDLTFSGVFCDGNRATMKATFDSVHGAILEATNSDSQTIVLEYLGMTSKGGNSAAAFHGLGSETDAGNQRVNLIMRNVQVHDMYSQRPGVGVFLGQTSGLLIDDECEFTNLRMETSQSNMYAGGAALAVIYLPSDSEMKIGGVFTGNSAFYPDASLHSGGGAVYLDYMEGDVYFNAKFENNAANQGGAVHVQGVLGNMYVDGLFIDNHAVDDGYGSRSGAFRVLEIASSGYILFSGSFIGNTAQGRGGAIATNMMRAGSTMELDGVFQSNIASTVGGVWSFWSDTDLEGQVILRNTCIFEGNQAVSDSSLSSIYDIVRGDKLSETEWQGTTIVLN